MRDLERERERTGGVEGVLVGYGTLLHDNYMEKVVFLR